MRLLALNWRDIRSPEAGGAEVHLHEVLRRLVLRGHEATVLCSHFVSGESPAIETVDGIRTIRTGAWWNAHLALPRAARRLLAREPFDVLLDDVNKIPFCAPSWSPIPVLGVFHHLLGRTVFLETNPIFAALVALYERRVPKVYRRTPVVAVSRSTAAELTARGLDQARVTIIPNGLDHRFYGPEPGPKARALTLIVVSRLRAYKRVDVAVRAFARVRQVLPDAELQILGEGPMRRSLEDLTRSLSVPVHFLGHVSEGEKASRLSRAHLTLLPSMKEGFGLVAIESMASGTPVVASDVPGHRDSVAEGAGLLVPFDDPEAMAAAAVALLTNPARYAAHRERGLHWASRFSWDLTAAAFEERLCEVAGLPINIPAALPEEALR